MKNLLIQYSTVASRNEEPFRWQAAGMGYAVRSRKGRFVVYDGGHTADAEPLIALLEKHSEGVPEVDLWIITHPHGDHYGAALEISSREELRARVKVNRFLFCLPDDAFAAKKQNIGKNDLPNVRAIPMNFGVPAYHAVTGDCYFTDDVKTEVLLTCEDLTDPSDANECSMISRVSAAGQTILFLGDAYSAPCRRLAARMGTALKSDFCQLAHHALNGGATELYCLAKPRVALIPMAFPACEEMRFGGYRHAQGTRHNRRVMEILPENCQWISAAGDRVALLPYDFSEWNKKNFPDT